jgi:hypothetical protein
MEVRGGEVTVGASSDVRVVVSVVAVVMDILGPACGALMPFA